MAVFADLPAEVRIQIWELCVFLMEPAVFVWGSGARGRKAKYNDKDVPFPRVRKRRYPLVTNTCRESRHHLLSPRIAELYYIGHDHRPLDPKIDIIFVRWPAHLYRMRMVTKLAIKYGNPAPWPAQVTRIALSQECVNFRNDAHAIFGRGQLFETLLGPQRPYRALKEVSLVCVDHGVDLDEPDPWVDLVEWVPARSSVRERETVLAMRELLATELLNADCEWACRSHPPAWEQSPGDMDRTELFVKHMVKPGLIREQSRGKGNMLKMKMVGLAHWWARHYQTPG